MLGKRYKILPQTVVNHGAWWFTMRSNPSKITKKTQTINLPIPSMYGRSPYIWLTFMINIAKQIQIYKTITIFTWFLNHPGIAKKTGRVFRATVRWGASSWQHHQRHRNLSPPTLLPLVWQEVGEDGIAKGTLLFADILAGNGTSPFSIGNTPSCQVHFSLPCLFTRGYPSRN